MRASGGRWIGIGALLAGLSGAALAYDQGKVQLAIAQPDPSKAGDQVTFQVILVNTGDQTWKQGDYNIEIEVYNADKKFLRRSEGLRGLADAPPGETILAYVPFSTPTDYKGSYQYRVIVTRKEQRVVSSDLFPFTVTPVTVIAAAPSAPVKPKAVQVGGNVVFSGRYGPKDQKRLSAVTPGTTESYRTYPATGNVSVNLVGRAFDRTFLFNAFTVHTPDNRFDLYTLLFAYYGQSFDITAGDIMPTFTNLTLSGSGVRGGQLTAKSAAGSASIVAARSAALKEGTTTVNGTFFRGLVGASAKLEQIPHVAFTGSYVKSSDDESSLSAKTRGPSLYAVKNEVVGGGVVVSPSVVEDVETSVGGEYAKSDFSPNTGLADGTTVAQPFLSDYAWRSEVKIKGRVGALRGMLQEARPNFVSLGSPTSRKDRRTIQSEGSLTKSGLGSINARLHRANDNLNNDANTNTTKEQIYGGGLTLALPRAPVFGVNYSLNLTRSELSSKPAPILDNKTDAYAATLTHTFRPVTVGLSGQLSKFKDLTDPVTSQNKDTITGAVRLDAPVAPWLSGSGGVTLSQATGEAGQKVRDQSNTYTLSLNVKLVPNRLGLLTFGNLVDRNKPADTVILTPKVETRQLSGNAELTYTISQAFAFTLGGGLNQIRDKIDEKNDLDELTGTTRLTVSF